MSGFLYVAIVVGWAVYLVPFALKRYDEATRNRSIDRFSSAMRVLGRSDHPTDERAADGPAADDAVDDAADDHASAPMSAAQRTAARVAARRRRRMLLLLLIATGATAGVAHFEATAWWPVAIPAGLVLTWLVVCRTQVRRSRAASSTYARVEDREVLWAEPLEDAAGGEPAVAGWGLAVPTAQPEVAPDDEPTVVLDRQTLASAGSAHSGTAERGSLWDPVPVTLPTYVSKPRAPRTIRTIDLGAPGVHSSGRGEESAIYTHHVDPQAEPAAEGPAVDQTDDDAAPQRRAVGE